MRMPFRLLLRRLARICFLLLVIGLIPVVMWVLTQDFARLHFNGLVESESENVGPVENARILAIEVALGQQVNAGDVLVRLDPADRAMDMAMNAARLNDYEQSILRYEQGVERHRQSLEDSERRCRQTAREAAVALETEKKNRSRDAAELAGTRAEIARLQPLVDRKLISETELSRLRPAAEALEKSVGQYDPLIAALEEQHTHALKDLEEVRALLKNDAAKGSASDPILTELRRAAETCRAAAAHDPAVLKATRNGIVARILHQPGDIVPAGEPIVRVSASSALYITGMLTQYQHQSLNVGDILSVTPLAVGAPAALTARVETIEPEVSDLLDPLNPAPRFPLRGRRVRLRMLDDANRLVPGETVSLYSLRRETWIEGIKRVCQLQTLMGNG
jgi:multidrug resistance efflux pump